MKFSQTLADEAFRKIWIGLGLTVLATILYASANGSVLDFPAWGLVGAFMLATVPVNANDDYIRSLHQSACNGVIWFLAVYFLGAAILSVTDLTYSVEFVQVGSKLRRSIDGWLGHYYDGLLIALVAALIYYVTFMIQNLRRGS